ncbi:MAG: hypothetical protein R3E95_23345, partial [Thiolinea sp.]
LFELILGKCGLKLNKPHHTKYFDISINNLRESGLKEYLPIGLMARSQASMELRKFDTSFYDLQETYEVVHLSGMRLYLTDYHLEMARLILAIEADPTQYPEATPDREQRTLPPEIADPDEPGILTLEGHILAAERLINETGYHRRDTELAELKRAIGTT